MFSAPKKGLKKDRGLLVFEDWSSGGISLPSLLKYKSKLRKSVWLVVESGKIRLQNIHVGKIIIGPNHFLLSKVFHKQGD